MFVNSTIQSTITEFNGNSFDDLGGFGILSSSYYVMDYSANKTYILNDSWTFDQTKRFNLPSYIIGVEKNLYMTGDWNLWKLNENLKTLIVYNATGIVWYRGLYFNSTNRLLYVAACALSVIHVFDLNLTFNHSFSTSPYNPFSIEGYNNQMYIGTTNGIVLVFKNEKVANQLNGCAKIKTGILHSILFDEYGFFATSCGNPVNQLYLHFSNGTSTGRTMATLMNPRYIGFDSKDHFILISGYQITIYN